MIEVIIVRINHHKKSTFRLLLYDSRVNTYQYEGVLGGWSLHYARVCGFDLKLLCLQFLVKDFIFGVRVLGLCRLFSIFWSIKLY